VKIFENYIHFILIIAIVIVSVLACQKIIFSSGIIMFSDLYFPLSLHRYINRFYPLWNDFGSVSTMDWVSRIAFTTPYISIALLLNLEIETFAKMMVVSILVFAGFSMYTLVTVLAKEMFRKSSDKSVAVAGFCSSIIYMFNPWIMSRMAHFYLLVGYASAPFALLSFIKSLESRKALHIVSCAVFWTLASSTAHYAFFTTILLSSWLIYLIILASRKGGAYFSCFCLKSIKVVVLTVLLYVAFNACWILPSLKEYGAEIPRPSYTLYYELIDLFSRNSDFINVVRLSGYWWQRVQYIPSFLNEIAGFALPLTILLGLLMRKKDRHVVYFSLMSGIFILLGMGSKSIIPYKTIVFHIPMVSNLGWLFRDPNKWVGLLALTFSFLAGTAILAIFEKTCSWNIFRVRLDRIFSKRKTRIAKVLILAMLISPYIVYAKTDITGYLGEKLVPLQVPREYYSVNTWLKDADGDFKAMWVPRFGGQGATWAQEGAIGPFDFFSSNKPTIGPFSPYSAHFYSYIWYILENNKTANLKKHLSPINTRYLIFHNDVLGYDSLEDCVKNLMSQKDLTLAKEENFALVFENKEWLSHIFIPSDAALIYGGPEFVTSMMVSESFKVDEYAYIFLSQKMPEQNELNVATMLVICTDYPFGLLLCLPSLKDPFIISPYDHVFNQKPSSTWSKFKVIDPIHGSWYPYLKKENIENWDFGYDKGLVATWARENTLDIPFIIQETDDYVFLIRYFQNQQGGEIQIQLDDMQYTISTKDQLNKFTWKETDTTHLESGQHKITLTNIQGFNAVNFFTLIPEQEYQKTQKQLEQTLQNKRIIYILEAENDLYYENAATSNKYGGEASYGQILILNQSSTVWQNISILNPSQYRITTRSKGQIQIAIDSQMYTVNSTRLNWNYIDPIYLDKGKHIIQISTPTNAELDVIYLFSTQNSNETLQDIFAAQQKPAEIINQTKINPTKYVVNVNATCSFTLAFAETYDPLWVAYVNGEKVSSTTLYGVINGFWINRTGQLSVTIEYEPQRWFYYGATISVGAFLACIAYSVWPWVRKRWKIVEFIKKRVKLLFRFSA